MFVVLQASLEQQSETTLLAESRKQHQHMQTDTAYIQVAGSGSSVCLGSVTTLCPMTLPRKLQLQVLALEAFTKRAEKLLQLLAELGRRLQLRLADAVHHSHPSPTDTARPGLHQITHLLLPPMLAEHTMWL